MNAFELIVGVILPPVTLVVFVGAMAWRLWAWRKMAQPGMTLFPRDPGGTFVGVLKETFLFPGLFRGDRVLWVISWIFHATLLLIIGGHLRVFTGRIDRMAGAVGIDQATMDSFSATAGGIAGIVIMVTVALFLLRRFAVQRVREISGAGDYFALVLLLAIILTGNAMRFLGAEHFDLAVTRAYFQNLVLFRAVTVPQNLWFLVHFLLVQLLVLYIPFSKILHFGGIFFTQAAVKRG